jgi:mannose-6-phosphate isomerase
MYPLRFKPVFKDYLWGGQNLKRFSKKIPDNNITAESWEISSHPDGMSIVSNGEFKGKTINDLIQMNPADFLGSTVFDKYTYNFPLLVKLIDAEKDLSVQVHPEDEYAKKHEHGDPGKNEMWYIMDAKEGSKLVYGMKDKISKNDFIKAIEEERIEECLETVPVKKGDILNIPAGLVHAIGKGIILAEIQQNSNTTYRLFDYNRTDINGNKRPLHLEKALDVINFNLNKKTLSKMGLEINITGNSKRTIQIINDYFIIENYCINDKVTESTDGTRFFIYVVVNGTGEIEHENKKDALKTGDTLLIPACNGVYSFSGNMNLLKAYVPDSPAEIIESLVNMGFDENTIKSNIQGL